jgi:outer membrane protein TolC
LPFPSNVASPQTRELNALLAKAETVHPDVASSRAQIQSLQHRLKAAELDRYPNFVLGLQHALVSDSGLAPSANGRDQVFASIGINIPLWQKPRRAKIREAAASIDEAQSQLAAVRADLRFRVEDAWLRLQSSRELIALFDQRILPESKQAFNVSIQSYAADRLTFLEVLDTWRQWLGYQLQQTQNHASLGQATAALHSASGEL